MQYIGIDLHKKFSQFTIMGEQGEIKDRRKIENTPEEILSHLNNFDEPSQAARYTDKDGQEKTIAGVIMGSPDNSRRFSDSRMLLASVRKGFGFSPVEAQPVGNVEIPPVDNAIAPPSRLRDRAPRQ